MASVTFEHAEIEVGGTTVLSDVSLTIDDGEFVGIIGPSGSGKTTLLRAVAGFADVTRGRVLFDGEDMTGVKVANRDVSMVFQQPVMFPNRSVSRNVSFPLELRKQHADEIRLRVDAEARALHLEHLLHRKPNSLSRGEAQLVQVARAMVRTPRVLLLDEPLAALDEQTGRRMRTELRILQEGYGVTTLMTTNDPSDAMQMPSRLAVLHEGRVVQAGEPSAVYRSPATLDAALGTGECWTVPVVVEAEREGYWLVRRGAATDSGGSGAEHAGLRHRAWAPALADWVGAEVSMMLRPADLTVVSSGSVVARVMRLVPGQPTMLLCEVAGRTVGVQSSADVAVGEMIRLRIDHFVLFDAERGVAIG